MPTSSFTMPTSTWQYGNSWLCMVVYSSLVVHSPVFVTLGNNLAEDLVFLLLVDHLAGKLLPLVSAARFAVPTHTTEPLMISTCARKFGGNEQIDSHLVLALVVHTSHVLQLGDDQTIITPEFAEVIDQFVVHPDSEAPFFSQRFKAQHVLSLAPDDPGTTILAHL